MSVKFWEIRTDGTQYKDNNEHLWYYDEQKERIIKADSSYVSVTDFYNHRELIEEIVFEEVINWSRINKYGKSDAWNDGKTSFTTTTATAWENTEPYEERM